MGDDKGKVQAWRNIKTDIGGRMMGFVCTIATMRGHRTVRRYSVFPASPGMPATSSRWQTGWRGNGGLSVLKCAVVPTAATPRRSEERRVGKEGFSPVRSGGAPVN